MVDNKVEQIEGIKLSWKDETKKPKWRWYFDVFIWVVLLMVLGILLYNYGFGFTEVKVYNCAGTFMIGSGEVRDGLLPGYMEKNGWVFNSSLLEGNNGTNR